MLKPRARGVARAVCEWRERRAMSVDVPVRQMLPDLAVLGIAQRQPKTTHELVQARGVDERHSKGNLGKEILDAVADGQRNDVDLPAPDGEELDRHLRPAVTLVSAWVAELARKQRVDTTLAGDAGRPGGAAARRRRRPACCTAGGPSCSATASSAWCRARPG